jgi:predicted acetyltransferase
MKQTGNPVWNEGAKNMVFREAREREIVGILKEGYAVWYKGRTWEQYFADNHKEDAYGTRYVVEDGGKIVSSLILLRLREIFDRNMLGIGSVITPPEFRHKGYAAELLENTMRLVEIGDAVFLYSEVPPAFYERFGFRVLPENMQKDPNSICMVRCEETVREKLLVGGITQLPDHF